MIKLNKSFFVKEFPIILIVIIGAILRFFNLGESDFTHDELSALTRLNFADLRTLLEQGVKIDGHPAGVQVFLYYWTHFFGNSETAVRTPFIILGILSIVLIYKIGLELGSVGLGLITAAFISSSQFFIYYSVLARPYSTGVFLALWLFLILLKLSKERHRGWTIMHLHLILATSLSMYNHYFSSLQMLVLVGFGIFKTRGRAIWIYMACLLISVTLFLPHIEITLFQFSKRGLEWLNSPDGRFHSHFFGYLCNFNIFQMVLLGLSILTSLVFLIRKRSFNTLQILFYFLIPYFVIFAYSIWVKPIIQYSSVIFCAPFLLIFGFGVFKYFDVKKWLIYATVLLVIGLNVYSLIITRDHYGVIKNQPFASLYDETKKYSSCENYYFISNQNPKLLNFYFSDLQSQSNFFNTFQKPNEVRDFELHMSNLPDSTIVTAESLPLNYREIYKRHFPFLIKTENGFTYDIQTRSNYKISPIELKEPIEHLGLAKKYPIEILNDEWVLNNSFELTSICKSRYNQLQLKVKLDSVKIQDEIIPVLELVKGEEKITWLGNSSKDFHLLEGSKKIVTTNLLLADLFRSNKEMKGVLCKCYLWNKTKGKLQILDFSFKVSHGNNLIYGIFQPI